MGQLFGYCAGIGTVDEGSGGFSNIYSNCYIIAEIRCRQLDDVWCNISMRMECYRRADKARLQVPPAPAVFNSTLMGIIYQPLHKPSRSTCIGSVT